MQTQRKKYSFLKRFQAMTVSNASCFLIFCKVMQKGLHKLSGEEDNIDKNHFTQETILVFNYKCRVSQSKTNKYFS